MSVAFFASSPVVSTSAVRCFAGTDVCYHPIIAHVGLLQSVQRQKLKSRREGGYSVVFLIEGLKCRFARIVLGMLFIKKPVRNLEVDVQNVAI